MKILKIVAISASTVLAAALLTACTVNVGTSDMKSDSGMMMDHGMMDHKGMMDHGKAMMDHAKSGAHDSMQKMAPAEKK